MSVPERYWHFVHWKEEERLARKLGLPYSDLMQNWTAQVADSTQLEEYLKAYDATSDMNERRLLMGLMINAVESADVCPGPGLRERLMSLLTPNPELHASLIIGFSSVREFPDGRWRFDEPGFYVTPSMREVLLAVREVLGFHELEVVIDSLDR